MGEILHDAKRAAASRRRLRWVFGLSAAGLLPYVIFVVLLSVDPSLLGMRPVADSPVSLAIYFALFLFAWPVIVAVIYLRGVEADDRANGVGP